MGETHLFIEVTTRAPDGSINRHSECHTTGKRFLDGAAAITFSPEFPADRAEEIAAEFSAELIDYDSFTMTDEAYQYQRAYENRDQGD